MDKKNLSTNRTVLLICAALFVVAVIVIPSSFVINSLSLSNSNNKANDEINNFETSNLITNDQPTRDTAKDTSNEEQIIIYADYFQATGGGGHLQDVDELWPSRNYYTPCFWEKIENNKEAIYFVTIKPKCLEYSYYQQAITTVKDEDASNSNKYHYSPLNFKEYKESHQWIIDIESKLFESMGIDVSIHWYGYKNDDFSLLDSLEENFLYPPQDNDIGTFEYFYTAYVSGEILLEYEQNVRNEFERIFSAYSDAVIAYYSNNYNIDIESDYILNFYSKESLYGNVETVDWKKYVYFDNKDVPEIAEYVQSKWQKHAESGLRPYYPCGGIITLLPCGYTEDEIVYNYYCSSFNTSG